MTETTTFEERLASIRADALSSLETEVTDLDSLAEWDRTTIGSKGSLTLAMRGLGALTAEERPAAGRAANAVKVELTAAYEAHKAALQQAHIEQQIARDAIDVTMPGRTPTIGVAHPISQMIDELSEIFAGLGFETIYGREVETGRYNFDMLNIPKDHPARDVWDTIFVESDEEVLLRTHTSPMQARVMEVRTPPIRVVVPGRTYRFEAQDASHEWMFHQLEGLAVDTHLTLADLKGVLQELARQLFGPSRRIRFRCDFFPFVEPGVDFAVDCAICDGKGCRVCKSTGWLEMGGAGMVHPNVLSMAGIDPDAYQGWAFGLGIERLIMMRHGVTDIRAFAGNDLRFLAQFAHAAI